MKTLRSPKLWAVCLLAVIFVLPSCEKEIIQPRRPQELQTSPISATFAVNPPLNSFTAAGSTAVLTGPCGSFTGNDIRAKPVAQTGGQFTIQISKVNGGTFLVGGTAYLRIGSVCGANVGTATYNAGSSSVSITFTANHVQGVSHYYPIFLSSNGSKLYSEPIMVYTTPMYSQGTAFGQLQGTVNGVGVYYNGTVSPTTYNYYNGINTGYKWQCVELANRYYLQVYGMNIRGTTAGNANQYYGYAAQKGLQAFPNGGSTPPRVGDLLCFSGGTGGYGHIMVITEVNSSHVKVAHQNVGSTAAIGCVFSRSGNSITAWSGYTCQGWLRKP